MPLFLALPFQRGIPNALFDVFFCLAVCATIFCIVFSTLCLLLIPKYFVNKELGGKLEAMDLLPDEAKESPASRVADERLRTEVCLFCARFFWRRVAQALDGTLSRIADSKRA